jgi:hypothetical protein
MHGFVWRRASGAAATQLELQKLTWRWSCHHRNHTVVGRVAAITVMPSIAIRSKLSAVNGPHPASQARTAQAQ